jgi:hypothetical protein
MSVPVVRLLSNESRHKQGLRVLNSQQVTPLYGGRYETT